MQVGNFMWARRRVALRGMVLLWIDTFHSMAEAEAVARWYNEHGFDVRPIGSPGLLQPLSRYAAAIANELRALHNNNREYSAVIFDGGALAAAVQLALFGDKVGMNHHFFVSTDVTERQWRAVASLKPKAQRLLRFPLEGLFDSVTKLSVATSRRERRRDNDNWMFAHQQFANVGLVYAEEPLAAREAALRRGRILVAA